MSDLIRKVTLPNGQPLTHYRLVNGLALYVIESHSAPVFHIQTWFKVGSRDEKLDPVLGCTGLAHLFEHMMFRGTPKYPDGQFDQILTRNGVQDENATTWLDRTNYYQSLPSSKLELVLQLEADRMANLKIEHDLLETEKSAVLGEYRMGLDDPTMMAYEHLYATAFQVHPYRFTTIGNEAEISGFSVENANYFYRKYYSPGNATIILSGDVAPEAALKLVDKYYGGYVSQQIDRKTAPVEPPQVLERRKDFTHPQLSESKLLIGYHTPEARHGDQPALWVLDSVLTTGQGSLLQEAWVDSGLTVDVGGGLDQFQDPGLWVLSADLQPEHTPEEALKVFDQVLEKLTKLNSSDLAQEVERARNQLLLALLRPWSENDGMASFMGEYIAAAGDPLFAFEQMEALEKVSSEDVLRVARQYLVPSNRTTIVGRPEAE